MKEKAKMFLRWLVTFVLCFVIIYLVVFLGGWKLLESGDPILTEAGIALILSVFVYAINEVTTKLYGRIKDLEERIKRLEDKS